MYAGRRWRQSGGQGMRLTGHDDGLLTSSTRHLPPLRASKCLILRGGYYYLAVPTGRITDIYATTKTPAFPAWTRTLCTIRNGGLLMRDKEKTLECENYGGDIHVAIDDMRPETSIKYCGDVCKREARQVRRGIRTPKP
jgi:hypothetical protein